jgi:hypothetical protein
MKTKLPSKKFGLSRRAFLQTLGAAGGALSAGPILALEGKEEPFALTRPAGWPVFRLVRPRDMLAIELELINLRVVSRRGLQAWGAEVHLMSHGRSGYIILHLPGQHIAEQAIWDRSNPKIVTDPADPPPPLTYELWQADSPDAATRDQKTLVQNNNDDLKFLARDRFVGEQGFHDQPQGLAGAWLSGPTQLVFEVPQRILPFQFEPDTILDLCARTLPLVVCPFVNSEPGHGGGDQPTRPSIQQPWLGHHPEEDEPPFTSVEFPTLLYVSPYANARWRQRPLTGSRRIELWSLDLEKPTSDALIGVPRVIRPTGHLFAFNARPVAEALWPKPTKEAANNASGDKYGSNERPKTTLYDATRQLLVKQLAENNADITAERLRLSSLGATARLHYRAAFEPGCDQQLNGEGQHKDGAEERLKSLKRALEHCQKKFEDYVGAAKDYFGGKDSNGNDVPGQREARANKPRPEVLGELLKLKYKNPEPLSPEEKKKIEEIFNQFPELRDPEGLLLEWIQKTEIGRDFYTKESFTGCWMPYGFRAEVVTITERLPCTDKLASPNEDVVELRDQESNLTAFLVSRRFARVRPWRDGTFRREFQPTESADFAPWLAQSGRTIGLRAVEILEPTTPVLANRGKDAFNMGGVDAALKAGEDLVVDSGDGTNAAREIFWPRVEAFEVMQDGRREPKLVIYKFRIRLTYLDGTETIKQLPMLFVPTLAQGALYYPKYPASLRTLDVADQVAVVEPPAPATLAGADLGSERVVAELAADLKAVIKEKPFQDLVAVAQIEKETSAAGTAAGLDLIAGSLNIFLDNLPSEVAKRLTIYQKEIGERFSGMAKFQVANTIPEIDAAWKEICDSLGQEVAKLGRDQRLALESVERASAWGMEELGSVGASAAAERLGSCLGLPCVGPGVTGQEIKQLYSDFYSRFQLVESVLTDALAKLEAADQQSTESARRIKDMLPLLTTSLQRLNDQLSSVPAEDVRQVETALSVATGPYLRSLRQLSTQWAIQLAPYWKREFWDEPFRKLACRIDPKLPAHLFSAVLLKEMQYAVLGGTAEISIKLDGNPDLKISFGQLANEANDLLPKIRPEALAEEVKSALDQLVSPALQRVEVLSRVLQGVEAALPDERVLRQRLHYLIEEHARLERKKLELEVRAVLSDIGAHLTFVLAHHLDGQARLARFLAKAMAAPEVAVLVERQIGQRVTELKEKTRSAVAGKLDNMGATKVANTLEKLVAQANPEHIKQRLEEMLDLSGGRIVQEIEGRVTNLRGSANGLIAAINARVGQTDANVRRTVIEVRSQLDQVTAQAEAILGKSRTVVATFLVGEAGNSLRSQVAGALKELRQKLVTSPSKPIEAWLGWVIGQVEGRVLSPRLLNMLQDLSTAILERAALTEDGIRWITAYRERLQSLFLEELKGGEDFTRDKFSNLCEELQAKVGEAEMELRERVVAIVNLSKDKSCCWIDLADNVFFALAAIPREFEAEVKRVLETVLKPLVESGLKSMLGPAWSRVQGLMNDLRGYVGDAQDFQHAVEKLSGSVRNDAQKKLAALRGELENVGDKLVKDLGNRAKNVEGEAFSFVKRALVSLPSPQLLNNFSDQTRKAVFKARNLVFTAGSIGEGLRSAIAHPKLESLTVKLPGLPEFTKITHAPDYIERGLRDFNSASGQVFAQIADGARRATGDMAAGIGAAAANVEWISREAGALSTEVVNKMREYGEQAKLAAKNLAKEAKLEFDLDKAKLNAAAANILGSPPPKLFGQINLSDILKAIQNPGDIPKVVSKEFPDRVENVLAMQNTPEKLDVGLLQFFPQDGTELTMESRTTAWLPLPGKPNRGITNSARGQLGPFKLVIGNVLGISFQSLSFVAENGGFKCHPKLGRINASGTTPSNGPSNPFDMIEFMGPLAFLQDVMRTFSSFLSGMLPFRLTCDGETIFAGIQIGLPALGFGAFSMTNLSFGMAVGLPLTEKGTLVYRFNIADQIETFKLSVCGFTGGGFFAMELSSDPTQGGIEAALEFGGSLSLNIGIAQGALSVMAGIYYHKRGAEVMLDAYLRACGVVVVLGFIEVSVIFYLAMQYHNGALAGQASITIRVKIGFFSRSFRLSYSKTIAGSQGSGSTAYLRSPARGGEKESLYASVESRSELNDLLLSDAPRYGYGFPTRFVSTGDPDPPDAASHTSPPKQPPRRFTERMTRSQWNKHWRQFDHHAIRRGNSGAKTQEERRRFPRCLVDHVLPNN